MARRPTVSESDLDKVRLFLRSMGATVARAVVEPGRVTITTTEGLALDGADTLPDTRFLENWAHTEPKNRKPPV